jgi:hypothetical protein
MIFLFSVNNHAWGRQHAVSQMGTAVGRGLLMGPHEGEGESSCLGPRES